MLSLRFAGITRITPKNTFEHPPIDQSAPNVHQLFRERSKAESQWTDRFVAKAQAEMEGMTRTIRHIEPTGYQANLFYLRNLGEALSGNMLVIDGADLKDFVYKVHTRTAQLINAHLQAFAKAENNVVDTDDITVANTELPAAFNWEGYGNRDLAHHFGLSQKDCAYKAQQATLEEFWQNATDTREITV